MATESTSLAEHLLASATGHFKWPTNAVLYHLPPERELLSDISRRLMFQAYLQVSDLDFEPRAVNNADYMSPTGTSPFLCLHVGPHPLLFSDFERMVTFLEAQNLGIKTHLESHAKSDQEAYLSLIKTRIATTEIYQTWANTANIKSSLSTHGFGLCWPLREVIPRLQQYKYMWNHWEMYRKPNREVLVDFEHACKSLSVRLGKNETFFDAGLTTLDVVIFAHLQASLSSPLGSELAKIILQFENLREFVQIILPAKGLELLPKNVDSPIKKSASVQRET